MNSLDNWPHDDDKLKNINSRINALLETLFPITKHTAIGIY